VLSRLLPGKHVSGEQSILRSMLATYIIFVHWLHINEQICKSKGYNVDLLHFIHDLDPIGSVGGDARDAMPGVCSSLFILSAPVGASPPR